MKLHAAALALAATLFCSSLAIAQDAKIALPSPIKSGGMPLMDALNQRESNRSFKSDDLTLQQISNLLWAANGINRSNGKRTAPSSMNYQEIDTYIALKDGCYKYNPKEPTLELVAKGDFRKVAGKQGFVEDAPVNLFFVADFSRVPKGETPEQLNASYANSGFIAQNVYLYCTSEGLGCVVRAYFDGQAVANVLKLSSKQKVILAQTVGYKK
jgi:SagB-type dehydrogenase family enzyme